MSQVRITKPAPEEHAEYYWKYTNLVPEGDIVETIKEQTEVAIALFNSVSEEKANDRYAPDKWSIKEVIGHILDGERIFAYRALRIARNDQTPLPGFEQDGYIAAANFDTRTRQDLVNEFSIVRLSTVILLENLSDEAWLRRGTASDAEISVRALAHIILGHQLHHTKILRERYL